MRHEWLVVGGVDDLGLRDARHEGGAEAAGPSPFSDRARTEIWDRRGAEPVRARGRRATDTEA